MLRIAVSLISDEQAVANLSETDGKDFDALAAEARDEWNERLGRIRVSSSDPVGLQTFYTCFYRTMLFPLAVWERTSDGEIVHWSPATGRTEKGHYYAGTGFWDTFRALFPLLNFLAPEMNARMMEGLENCWKESGWLPEWSSPGLTDCMIGNNSASVVADAWLSGVRGDFDIDELWKALVHGANNAHPEMKAVGRCGVEYYNELGYVPRDVGIRESAARTLEYAYDDWCIAKLAQALGKTDEAAKYMKRSANWRNVFDPMRRIAVGRNRDGSFDADFNRYSWGGDFTEGCALHYTWSVFQDVPGLMEAMDRLYRPTPDGYCGDEDNGQTSAWYVWSALGLYPVCPGSGEYALGAPRFDSIDVTLPSGKTLSIRAPGAAVRQVFSSASLGGARLSRPFVCRSDILTGGGLAFEE